MLNEYLIENYDKLKDMAFNIAGRKGKDDLLSFVIEELYKCDQDRINEIIEKNQLTFYVARVMLNQYHSKTSRYYYKYNKYYEYHTTTTIESITADNTEYTIKDKKEVEERLEWVEDKLKDCYWFDSQVFKVYYLEEHSLNSMAKATKINRNTLFKAINNVKKYLIKEKENV
jgi:DNA-directed RNA polymerase specialized sigma24 family protein|tara:strand:+ start:2769 stop:3284 length:516 start_codon:yes stop_codon:yes gene_type:complete